MTAISRSLALCCAVVGLAAGPGQGPALNSVMRDKLGHAQQLLEALVTSDWVSLETHSRELERLTTDRRWTVLKYPEYAKHSAAFLQAVQALHTAAAQRDLAETPKAYVTVTLECVTCHQYLARERLAR
jgi:hypothetical protein